MLKKASDINLEAILGFCKGDLIGARIGCYCLAYGFDREFLGVWMNIVDDKIKAVIAKFYDSISIKADSDCEAEELRQFTQMLGYSEIMCTKSCSEILGLNHDKIKKAYIFRGKAEGYSADDIGEDYYKQLYTLVSSSIPNSFADSDEAYLSFLSDFTFRKRRNLARSKGVFIDGKLASSVITSAETDSDALLSAVACDKNIRGQGLGKKTVLSIVNELINENKNVFVIALNESAQGFYEHIGFEYYTDICYIERTKRNV